MKKTEEVEMHNSHVHYIKHSVVAAIEVLICLP